MYEYLVKYKFKCHFLVIMTNHQLRPIISCDQSSVATVVFGELSVVLACWVPSSRFPRIDHSSSKLQTRTSHGLMAHLSSKGSTSRAIVSESLSFQFVGMWSDGPIRRMAPFLAPLTAHPIRSQRMTT